MAKCKWFSKDKQTGFSKCSVPRKNTNYTKCPRYADPSSIDSRCNIIPKKPKTRSVKAWAWLDLKGNITAATVNKCGSKIRCTITYRVKGEK